jgi:signal peptidase II
MEVGESYDLTSFLDIVLVKNKGVTFGLLNGVVSPLFLTLASIAIIIFMVYWAINNENYLLPISAIVGGALGNVVDRITRGAVVDFLDFHLFGYHWPAFNIADSAIVIATFALFFILYGEES